MRTILSVLTIFLWAKQWLTLKPVGRQLLDKVRSA